VQTLSYATVPSKGVITCDDDDDRTTNGRYGPVFALLLRYNGVLTKGIRDDDRKQIGVRVRVFDVPQALIKPLMARLQAQ
jgi:hypothetical protein